MRVLSIQSHVVSGYAGNKAAVFPLQLLGFDVDVINSVQFSNHTGYAKKWEGEVLNGTQLGSLLEGLERNDLLSRTDHLLTGYIGSESFLHGVLKVLRTLKKHNPDCRYICDTVFGDNGKLYVPAELVGIYREEVIPLANVVTPNQFEAEQLTGISIQSLEDAKTAIRALHDLGPEVVVVTSMILEEHPDKMYILASQRFEGGETDQLWLVESQIIEGSYTGTGDLTAALFLAWTAKEPGKLGEALEKVVSTMFSVIKKTSEASDGSVRGTELKLVQSKALIENPPSLFKATQL